jgi:hypothetical protein
LPRSPISTSMMPSAPRTAPTRRPPASRITCLPTPGC